MAQIARLHTAQIANGNVINATDLSDEFNQLVTAHNDVDDRLDDIENNNVSLDGVKTFLDNPKMDGITEKTSNGGVAIDNMTLKDGSLIHPAATELTIASGAITVTQGIHSVDTESDAASDDLITINGVAANQRIILYAANDARTVVLKHGSGNIFTANGQDLNLDDDNKRIEIIGDGTNVYVMGVTTAPTPEIQSSYTSSNQTITSGGALTLPHGLGAMPELVQCRLKCLTAELNYSIGEELITDFLSQANRGLSVVVDSTNINVRFGSDTNVFVIHNKTTGATASATNANWALIVKAWA